MNNTPAGRYSDLIMPRRAMYCQHKNLTPFLEKGCAFFWFLWMNLHPVQLLKWFGLRTCPLDCRKYYWPIQLQFVWGLHRHLVSKKERRIGDLFLKMVFSYQYKVLYWYIFLRNLSSGSPRGWRFRKSDRWWSEICRSYHFDLGMAWKGTVTWRYRICIV